MSTHSDLPVAVIGAGPVGLAAASHLIERGSREALREPVKRPRRICATGAMSPVLAVALQHGCGRKAHPAPGRLAGAARRRSADRPRPVRRLSQAACGNARDRPVVETRAASARQSPGAGSTRWSRRSARHIPSRSPSRGTAAAHRSCARRDRHFGTWQNPNPSAPPACRRSMRRKHADRIAYGIPDILGTDRALYAGQRVLVIGGGHSAANALLDLAKLAETMARRITWALAGKARRAFSAAARPISCPRAASSAAISGISSRPAGSLS